MQSYPILQTKLYMPPVRANLVPRPRLIEWLNAGLDRKLSLVCAPAGFGKTTLVGEWIYDLSAESERTIAESGPRVLGTSSIDNRVAWLSLDQADNDPARFLTYLIAALRTIDATLAKRMLSALQSRVFADANTFADASTPPPAEVVLVPLINDLVARPDRLVLVLDDYHVIETQAVHDALAFLLEPLSKRELDVLELIAQGLTNREIASRLYLSLNTVKAHTRNIYGKLGVHSRTQAIARSQALGILPRQ